MMAGTRAVDRVRAVRLGPPGVRLDRKPDGTRYVQSIHPLGDYPVKLTDRLDYWASQAPDRTLYAKRINGGEWRNISYAEAQGLARNIAQALVNRGLSAERPIAILSGNDLEHALLSLGAMYAAVPFRPHLGWLLAALVRFRQASLHPRSRQARPRLRFERPEVPARHRRRSTPWRRTRRHRRPAAWRYAVLRT